MTCASIPFGKCIGLVVGHIEELCWSGPERTIDHKGLSLVKIDFYMNIFCYVFTSLYIIFGVLSIYYIII